MSEDECSLASRLLKQLILTVCKEVLTFKEQLKVACVIQISVDSNPRHVIKVRELFQRESSNHGRRNGVGVASHSKSVQIKQKTPMHIGGKHKVTVESKPANQTSHSVGTDEQVPDSEQCYDDSACQSVVVKLEPETGFDVRNDPNAFASPQNASPEESMPSVDNLIRSNPGALILKDKALKDKFIPAPKQTESEINKATAVPGHVANKEIIDYKMSISKHSKLPGTELHVVSNSDVRMKVIEDKSKGEFLNAARINQQTIDDVPMLGYQMSHVLNNKRNTSERSSENTDSKYEEETVVDQPNRYCWHPEQDQRGSSTFWLSAMRYNERTLDDANTGGNATTNAHLKSQTKTKSVTVKRRVDTDQDTYANMNLLSSTDPVKRSKLSDGERHHFGVKEDRYCPLRDFPNSLLRIQQQKRLLSGSLGTNIPSTSVSTVTSTSDEMNKDRTKVDCSAVSGKATCANSKARDNLLSPSDQGKQGPAPPALHCNISPSKSSETCKECNMDGDNMGALGSGTLDWICGVCEEPFHNDSTLYQHMELKHHVYKCEFCGHASESKRGRSQHIRHRHFNKSRGEMFNKQ